MTPSLPYRWYDTPNVRFLSISDFAEFCREQGFKVEQARYLDGHKLTEPLLNQVEVAIRAYDPCLSCATHALGKMGLRVQLLDAAGNLMDEKIRG